MKVARGLRAVESGGSKALKEARARLERELPLGVMRKVVMWRLLVGLVPGTDVISNLVRPVTSRPLRRPFDGAGFEHGGAPNATVRQSFSSMR